MGDQTRTRNREYLEGWLGRRRTYTCKGCNVKFQADTLTPLLGIDKFCPNCNRNTHVYVFVNKRTVRDTKVRAKDVQMATLQAWQIDPNLTFKIP